MACYNNNGGCDQVCRDDGTVTSCSCRYGFGPKADQKTCQDVDECTEGQHDCKHTCTNTLGSYNCFCRDGFIGSQDNKECNDVDECAEGQHDCNQTCTNTLGSYNCSCKDGFIGSQDNKECNYSMVNDTFPLWAIGPIVAVVVVVIAVIVIAVLLKRRSRRTTDNPVQGKEERATQGPVTAPTQGPDTAPGTTRPLPDTPKPNQAHVGGTPSEGVYIDILDTERAWPPASDKPDQTYYNDQPPRNLENYERLMQW